MSETGGPPPIDEPNPYRDTSDAPKADAGGGAPPPQDLPPGAPGIPGAAGEPPLQAFASSKDERSMGMLTHLLGLFTHFIGPLIIWLVKKDESPFIDAHGKEALNFQLTLMIGYFISALLTYFCIGIFLFFGLYICGVVFCIQGCIAANNGQMYRYPVSIRMIT